MGDWLGLAEGISVDGLTETDGVSVPTIGDLVGFGVGEVLGLNEGVWLGLAEGARVVGDWLGLAEGACVLGD